MLTYSFNDTAYILTRDSQQMTLQEAQILVLRVLKQVMEEKLDHHNVQLAQVGSANLFALRLPLISFLRSCRRWASRS